MNFTDLEEFAEQETGRGNKLYSGWLLFTHLASL